MAERGASVNTTRCLAFVALGLLWGMAAGADYPEPVAGDFTMRNFSFASGERLPELTIHYRTIGTPRKDAAGMGRNAVLLLHGTTGSGKGFLPPNSAGTLFGPGQPLDASRYYLILPDGIGHGESSRPSLGLHARFPPYTHDALVAAQPPLVAG